MQDSLVVCRLRKNIEFRPSDSSTRAAPGQRHLPNSNYAVSGLSEGDRAVGSSNDSYSIEQIGSTSESEQKRTCDATLAETSSQQKVGFILAKDVVEHYMHGWLMVIDILITNKTSKPSCFYIVGNSHRR
jgi:hypothetical protein